MWLWVCVRGSGCGYGYRIGGRIGVGTWASLGARRYQREAWLDAVVPTLVREVDTVCDLKGRVIGFEWSVASTGAKAVKCRWGWE